MVPKEEKTKIVGVLAGKITARNITVLTVTIGVVLVVGFFALVKGTCQFNLRELVFDCEDRKVR